MHEADQIREEGDQISFVSRGREMRIPKDQVERIFKTEPRTAAPRGARSKQESGIGPGSVPAITNSVRPSGSSLTGVENGREDLLIEDIRWGLAPEDIEGLVFSGRDPAYGGVVQYYRPEEDLSMGRADLRGIVYGFWRNRLYTITAWADGMTNFRKMRTEAFKRYGRGNQRRKGVERYTWIDAGSDRMLSFESELNVGLFWMRSRIVDRDVKKLFPE
jgi:hypothetical protein